jgi:hypothetical protein
MAGRRKTVNIAVVATWGRGKDARKQKYIGPVEISYS